MKFDPESWQFRVFGEVENPLELSWEEFLQLPAAKVTADFHCVTGWSKLENEWEGVLGKTIYESVGVRSNAKYVILHSYSGYTSNTTVDVFLRPDTILAYKLNGAPLSPEHGGPLRAVVSSLYAYKSVKWLTAVEFSTIDKPGYWEIRGYHNVADPWKEQRYEL